MKKPWILWWSGGVTSAIACWIALKLFGKGNCWILFIDTFNEDDDTYRFKEDCEKWYGHPIETVTAIGQKFKEIKEIWYHFKSLNNATGAICSSTLKRDVRVKWLAVNDWEGNVFGFDIDEPKRIKGMTMNWEKINPVYPLAFYGYTKKKCIEILQSKGIEIPRMYKAGFNNNNCWKTGCVQGGIGYWQLMRVVRPEIFDTMAIVEHEITDLKGEPVTMLKDQSKHGGLVFLKPHPNYPLMKDISMMKGRPVKPLFECNGFCGTNDLQPNETMQEINYIVD